MCGEELRGTNVYLVILNGRLIGVHNDADGFVRDFRSLRRANEVPPFVSVYKNPLHKTVYIACDGGRLCRPLIVRSAILNVISCCALFVLRFCSYCAFIVLRFYSCCALFVLRFFSCCALFVLQRQFQFISLRDVNTIIQHESHSVSMYNFRSSSAVVRLERASTYKNWAGARTRISRSLYVHCNTISRAILCVRCKHYRLLNAVVRW
jgi:hypothetical protein